MNFSPIQADGSIDTFRADRLQVYVHDSRRRMAAAAAAAVAGEMRRSIAARGRAIGLFDAAPSQSEFLDALTGSEGIEWTRVIGLHMGEYIGMNEDAPQSSRRFLLDRLVRRVPVAEFHGIRGEAANARAVCANYAALLGSRPPDFAALDIDENGRLAFIGPAVCDFNDPSMVRVVELEDACRGQQVNDGAFATIEEAPRRAISLTIPAIVACHRLFAIAPGERKQQAVRDVIYGEVTTSHPASILRTHPDAHLFLDREAAGLLPSFFYCNEVFHPD